MTTEEILAAFRALCEAGELECLCTVCGEGVCGETLRAQLEHRDLYGHLPTYWRRDGEVVYRATGLEQSSNPGDVE